MLHKRPSDVDRPHVSQVRPNPAMILKVGFAVILQVKSAAMSCDEGQVTLAARYDRYAGSAGSVPRLPAAAFGQLRQLLPSPEGQCARRTSETARTSRPFSTPAPHLSHRCDAQSGVAR